MVRPQKVFYLNFKLLKAYLLWKPQTVKTLIKSYLPSKSVHVIRLFRSHRLIAV